MAATTLEKKVALDDRIDSSSFSSERIQYS